MAASATAPAAAPAGAVSAGAYSSCCALQYCLRHLAFILAMPLIQDSSCGIVPVLQEGVTLNRVVVDKESTLLEYRFVPILSASASVDATM